MIRIAHIVLSLAYQSGVVNKLISQANVAKRESIPIDYYWITSSPVLPGERGALNILSIEKQNLVLTRLSQLRAISELMRGYTRLILRYPLVDPVLTVALKQKERIILEHHSKELEELRLKKDPRYLPERLFGGSWIRTFGGLIGVTPELVDYEVSRSSFKGSTLFIPNSLDASAIPPLKSDRASGSAVQAIMVANFRPWHGVDKILENIERHQMGPHAFILHLVGALPEPLEARARSIPSVICHGHLQRHQIEEIASMCDVGLGVFDLQSKGMTQATSLKVREYLSLGLPVVEGCVDPAFPEEFPYLLRQAEFDVLSLIEFALQHRSTSRQSVHEAAAPYIDSRISLRTMYEWASRV